MSTARLPHWEQTSRFRQSGTGVSGPYRRANFGWRSHLRWLRQELRSGIGTCATYGGTKRRRSGLSLISAFEAPDDEPNTGSRRAPKRHRRAGFGFH
jgi:hypothetical protein